MRRLAVTVASASLLLGLADAERARANLPVHAAHGARTGTGTRSATALGPRSARSASTQSSSAKASNPGAPIPVAASNKPPAGRRLSSNRVLAIAAALPQMKALSHQFPGDFADPYLKLPFRWQVSYFSHNGKKEVGQVIIDDLSGRVLEAWTGFQVAWTMARGYPGAFGKHVSALYIWLPLCVLFLLPFVNPRRPFSLLHLDLLVLLSLSVSLAFFSHGRIYASVPLAYPPLLYLLVRMLLLARPGRRRAGAPLRLLVPASWLAVGVLFLLGFRIALNITDSNVIDVGYAGVIGAKKIVQGKPLYGHWPADNEHGDTYGPVNYEAYVPFAQVFGWSGRWDSLAAAHAASIAFDVLALVLVFMLGRRVRGPTLGIALAYAWVSYPFTLFALECNSNDTLVAVIVLAALLAASSAPARGALAALAGLTKFAPLALAPMLATSNVHSRLSERRRASGRVRWRVVYPSGRWGPVAFLLAFALAGAAAAIPALSHDSLHTIYERTLAYQANRGSPFSVWGLYGGLAGVQRVVQIAAVVLALALALTGVGRDLVALAAACAAVLIATQLGIDHWFYLYIPWFFGLAMLALLGSLSAPEPPLPGAASAPARSTRPALAVSSG